MVLAKESLDEAGAGRRHGIVGLREGTLMSMRWGCRVAGGGVDRCRKCRLERPGTSSLDRRARLELEVIVLVIGWGWGWDRRRQARSWLMVVATFPLLLMAGASSGGSCRRRCQGWGGGRRHRREGRSGFVSGVACVVVYVHT